MGIVGTVDSAYKALLAAAPELDDAAMTATGEMALDSGTPVVFDAVGASEGVRRRASCKRAAGNASVQRRRWRGTMGDERHKAQARAAQCASGGGGRSIEAREEVLDGERRGLEGGRLAERGARAEIARIAEQFHERVAHRTEQQLGHQRPIPAPQRIQFVRDGEDQVMVYALEQPCALALKPPLGG